MQAKMQAKLAKKELKLISMLLEFAYYKVKDFSDDRIGFNNHWDYFAKWDSDEIALLIQGISDLYDDESILKKQVHELRYTDLINFFSYRIKSWLDYEYEHNC